MIPKEHIQKITGFLLQYKKEFVFLLKESGAKDVQLKMIEFYFNQYAKTFLETEEEQEETIGELLNVDKKGLEEFTKQMEDLLTAINKPITIEGKKFNTLKVFEMFIEELEKDYLSDLEM